MTQQGAAHSTTNIQPYQYWAHVERVVDGDTIDLKVAVGFDAEITGRFRLLGVDTPEMFGTRHADAEHAAGVAARQRVEALIPADGWVEVKTYKLAGREKFGRYLCEIFIDGESLSDRLLREGLAAPVAWASGRAVAENT
jgi:micrococcal nuclease